MLGLSSLLLLAILVNIVSKLSKHCGAVASELCAKTESASNSTYKWTSSGLPASSTSCGLALGDFIASGIGIDPTTTSSSLTTIAKSRSSTDSTSSSVRTPGTTSTIPSISAQQHPSTGNTSRPELTSATSSVISTAPVRNQTSGNNAMLHLCWSKWESYWDAIAGFTSQLATGCHTSVSTYSHLFTLSYAPASTGTYTYFDIETLSNGPFIFSATTSVHTTNETYTAQSGTTGTYTESDGSISCAYTLDMADGNMLSAFASSNSVILSASGATTAIAAG